MHNVYHRLKIATAAAMLCLPASASYAFWGPGYDGYGYRHPYPAYGPYGYSYPYGAPPAPQGYGAAQSIPAPTTSSTAPAPTENPVPAVTTSAPAPTETPVPAAHTPFALSTESPTVSAAPAAAEQVDSQHPPLPVTGEVTLSVVSGGWVLANASGLTLYTFTQDSPNQSNCTGECAENWPPVIAANNAVTIDNFSLVRRGDGALQWAYMGKPLYTWVGDGKPGDMTGDGIGGVWNAARL